MLNNKIIRRGLVALFGGGGAIFALPQAFQALGMAQQQASDLSSALITAAVILVSFGVDHILDPETGEGTGTA